MILRLGLSRLHGLDNIEDLEKGAIAMLPMKEILPIGTHLSLE